MDEVRLSRCVLMLDVHNAIWPEGGTFRLSAPAAQFRDLRDAIDRLLAKYDECEEEFSEEAVKRVCDARPAGRFLVEKVGLHLVTRGA